MYKQNFNFDEYSVDIKNWASEPEVVSFLCSLAIMTGARKILEIGTFKGGTSAALLEAVKNCQVTTLDIVDYASKNFSKLQKSQKSRLKYFVEKDREKLQLKDNSFDFVFIDADHNFISCIEDFSFALNKVERTSIMVFHDTVHPVLESYRFGIRLIQLVNLLLGKKIFSSLTLPTPNEEKRTMSGITILYIPYITEKKKRVTILMLKNIAAFFLVLKASLKN